MNEESFSKSFSLVISQFNIDREFKQVLFLVLSDSQNDFFTTPLPLCRKNGMPRLVKPLTEEGIVLFSANRLYHLQEVFGKDIAELEFFIEGPHTLLKKFVPHAMSQHMEYPACFFI